MYDDASNVVGLLDETGVIVAAYAYDPYGKLVHKSGAQADMNPFGYSTKFTDRETGLVYYGHRYYDPMIGRFINRDPIEEAGGRNLYGFVGNSPLDRYDYLGMYDPDNPIFGGVGSDPNDVILSGIPANPHSKIGLNQTISIAYASSDLASNYSIANFFGIASEALAYTFAAWVDKKNSWLYFSTGIASTHDSWKNAPREDEVWSYEQSRVGTFDDNGFLIQEILGSDVINHDFDGSSKATYILSPYVYAAAINVPSDSLIGQQTTTNSDGTRTRETTIIFKDKYGNERIIKIVEELPPVGEPPSTPAPDPVDEPAEEEEDEIDE